MAKIQELIAQVMTSISHVGKTGHNPQGNFKFRGIDAVVNAVGPALRQHKVIIVPTVKTYETGEVEVGKNRTLMSHAKVIVTYTWYGPEGDSIEMTAPGEAMDSGDKATAKAMSVAFRTALLQSLALPTDEPDPDESLYERTSPTEALYEEFSRQIDTATEPGQLAALGTKIMEARNKNQLTAEQYTALGNTGKAKKNSLTPPQTERSPVEKSTSERVADIENAISFVDSQETYDQMLMKISELTFSKPIKDRLMNLLNDKYASLNQEVLPVA